MTDRSITALKPLAFGARAAGIVAVVAVFLSAIVFAFGFVGFQLAQLQTKVDAIPEKLSAEFRAMRAEQSAQTSAIANSITATKQQVPQVILVPAPP